MANKAEKDVGLDPDFKKRIERRANNARRKNQINPRLAQRQGTPDSPDTPRCQIVTRPAGHNKGKNKPAITGLMAFASQLKPIWAAAIKDDPYAEWWLYRIEQSIIRSRNALRGLQARFENELGSVSGLEIPLGESTEPVQVDIQFSVPLAFKAAPDAG